MKKLLSSSVGQLRILAFLEGISLLVLIFLAVPLKYLLHYPILSQIVGPIHGALFLLFILNTLRVGTEEHWQFKKTTWKVLIACIIPFGTFYIDAKILRNLHTKDQHQD